MKIGLVGLGRMGANVSRRWPLLAAVRFGFGAHEERKS